MNAAAVIASVTQEFGMGRAVQALTDRIHGDPDTMTTAELAAIATQLPTDSRVRQFVLAQTSAI